MRHQWFVMLPLDNRLPRPRCSREQCQLEVMYARGIAHDESFWQVELFCNQHATERMELEGRKP